MDRRFSVLIGITLIMVGLLALMFTLVTPLTGINVWRVWLWGLWRLWPLIVIGVGGLFTLPPLLIRGQRGLGILFIPGLLILATGGILLFASVFDAWGTWAWLWPLEVLALAMGFMFTAFYIRTVWLAIPGIIIGLNGLVLQFCALTGWWSAWSVLWTVEPLAVGLSILAISARTRSMGLFVTGLIVCGLAGVALIGMVIILSGRWWVTGLVGPALLILVGGVILVWSLLRHPLSPRPAS